MKVIGIAGMARAGKDTFVKIAIDILQKNNYRATRMAFADKLKDEAQSMLKQNNFSATVFTDDTKVKSLIRPLLVWWGCQRRNESEGGLYWVNEVDKQIRGIQKDYEANGESDERVTILVSDVRFQNEAQWVQKTWGGSVIHLKRFQSVWRKGGQDGSDEFLVKEYDLAPNEEEAKQDPLVERIADVKTEWESKKCKNPADASTIPELQQVVINALNQIKFFKYETPIIGKLSL